jgi:hypothetical protein
VCTKLEYLVLQLISLQQDDCDYEDTYNNSVTTLEIWSGLFYSALALSSLVDWFPSVKRLILDECDFSIIKNMDVSQQILIDVRDHHLDDFDFTWEKFCDEYEHKEDSRYYIRLVELSKIKADYDDEESESDEEDYYYVKAGKWYALCQNGEIDIISREIYSDEFAEEFEHCCIDIICKSLKLLYSIGTMIKLELIYCHKQLCDPMAR